MAAMPPASTGSTVAHSVPAGSADPALIGIGLTLAFSVAGLNFYRLWLDGQGVESRLEDSFMPNHWMDESGERARSRASAVAVLKIIVVLTLAAAFVGGAAALHQSRLSFLPLIALMIIVGTFVFSISHVLWLWDDRRKDAFASIFWRRKDVPWLYDERAVRKLFFRQNPMPIWTVFDRSWRKKLVVPNGSEMHAVTLIAKQGCAFKSPNEIAGFRF